MKKPLIVYYSKNGTTEETVKRIKKETANEVATLDLQSKERKIRGELLAQYEEIYIGCGIYMEKLPSPVVRFLLQNQEVLKNKRIILFLHGLISGANYPGIVEKSLKRCKALAFERILYLGGKLDIREQNIFIRSLLSALAKKSRNTILRNSANNLIEEKITELIKCFSPN